MKVGASILSINGECAVLQTSVQLTDRYTPLKIGEHGLYMPFGAYWCVQDANDEPIDCWEAGLGIPDAVVSAIKCLAENACYAGYRVCKNDDNGFVEVVVAVKYDLGLVPELTKTNLADQLLAQFRNQLLPLAA